MSRCRGDEASFVDCPTLPDDDLRFQKSLEAMGGTSPGSALLNREQAGSMLSDALIFAIETSDEIVVSMHNPRHSDPESW
jgi:hypothetical protein